MSALFHTPGPIELFVKFRDGRTLYLGTCAQSPEVEVRPAYIDIKNDLGGRSVPITKIYDGEQHLIYLTATNRFDWRAYKLMKRDAVSGDVGPGVSLDGALNRGSIAIGTYDFELVLRYAFGGTAVASTEMPYGRRYYSCVLVAAKESTVGTRLMEVSMAIEANGLFRPDSRSFLLYSELADDVTNSLPAVN